MLERLLKDLDLVWGLLNETIHENVSDLASYMETTYIIGHPAKVRKRAIPPKCLLILFGIYIYLTLLLVEDIIQIV